MRIGPHELAPFTLGVPAVTRALVGRSPVEGMAARDPLSSTEQTFYRLLNAGNQHAFGGMGMPAWVQLDCCTLPTAMTGFSVPRAAVDEALYGALAGHVERVFGAEAGREARAYDGPVPVSEYCALSTAGGGSVVGFSLFSLLHGIDLGIRTKAMALLCLGARTQVGLTQYANGAVRTHALLGPLRITHAVAPPHSRPRETFVYEVDVSDAAHLRALVDHGASARPSTPEANVFVPVKDAAATGVEVGRLLASNRSVDVVWPGLRGRGDEAELCLHVA